MLVDGWLERAARAVPGVSAVETPLGGCSYAELLVQARAGAGYLAKQGVQPGERVAIALPAGLDFVRALHACLLLGTVAVPVDLRLGAAEQMSVTAGAAAIVDQPLPTGDGGLALGAASLRALNATSAWGPDAAGTISRHDLDATAVIIHTSGTTSEPKPIELTYGNFLWSALGSAVALGLDPRERWLCALPLSHVGGLSILIRSAIYGTTAVVHERFETERALAALHDDGITLVSVVATTLTRLLDAGLERPAALRCALTGGGPVPAALLERARATGVPVSQTYGLTESCSQVTTTPLAAIDANSVNAGTPLFCTHLRISADGEILVAGPTIAPGSRDADGWLATGDLGELDDQGRLRVTGRKADTIISGGENVAPTEVEAALEAHPGVLEAAVVGRVDPQWGEAVAAIVVARAGAALDEETLRLHCAERLASYKVPKRIALVAGPLPRTRSGKLLRREL
jgi:o-succinylbenzoate---CoA ligase